MTTKIDLEKLNLPEKLKSNGRIIKVHPKGYGFLISNDHPFTKFFFHWTGLTQTTKKFSELQEGMKVKFVPLLNDGTEPTRGPRAIQIEVIE